MLLLAALIGGHAHAQTDLPAPGVSLELARQRAVMLGNLRYDLFLSIPASVDAPITGATTIRFDLKNQEQPLVLDFEAGREQVTTVDVNGEPAAFSCENGHIVVPSSLLATGPNAVRIAFQAGDASLNRSPDFLYSLFVPARARLAMPCFDQPDLKGRWSVTLEHPAGWQSAANGAERERTVRDGRATVRFTETPPLPTYLVAFIAGEFLVESAERGGRVFRMFHRETDAAKVARNRDALFDLHAHALDYLEAYTEIPYGFGKFDFALIPAFQFSGMEHPGLIAYRGSRLLLDESATQDQVLARASVIAHETAHMWFGDLVTMRWFNDVWMKEVFATLMAAKIVRPSFPRVNHELRFLLSNYPSAYAIDRTAGANPIRQPLGNLKDAGSLYGSIIYRKAPIVLRHLEALLGQEHFRDGVREYLAAHSFGNASWTDLITVLDRGTPVDLSEWSSVWVDAPGRPTITTELQIQDGSISRLAFRQSDPFARGLTWPQELRVLVGTASACEKHTVKMSGPLAEVRGVAGKPAPGFVLPGGDGWAYGAFELDGASLRYLVANVEKMEDPLTRGSAWIALWDALLEGHLPPEAFFDLVLRALACETDEQMTARLLRYASATWWRLLGAEDRKAGAAEFESVLRRGMAGGDTPSRKAAWFAALRRVARTPATVDWLRQVWEKNEEIDGLPLAEDDYTSLAYDLAVRQVDDWRSVLEVQLGRIENADRKARFEFVMPALSADPAVRARWFLSLEDPDRRRREPWVLKGLEYVHHPCRAEASMPLVRPSLDLLWEIQKTGDIFFPKSWLDVTLGGYASRDAADTVRVFLEELPEGFPERLRMITLQSADPLFRAAQIRGKAGP